MINQLVPRHEKIFRRKSLTFLTPTNGSNEENLRIFLYSQNHPIRKDKAGNERDSPVSAWRLLSTYNVLAGVYWLLPKPR